VIVKKKYIIEVWIGAKNYSKEAIHKLMNSIKNKVLSENYTPCNMTSISSDIIFIL